MRLHCPPVFSAVDELHSFVLEAQGLFADTRKCSDRSRTREPQSIKQLRLQLRSCTDEQTRRQLQRTLWNYRMQFLESLAAQRCQLKVARGGVLARSKKMHRITKMQLTSQLVTLVASARTLLHSSGRSNMSTKTSGASTTSS